MMQLLDPSHEASAAGVELARRLDTLRDRSVALISNGKEGTRTFFGHLERLLREEHGVANVELLVKSNYSAPADAHIVADLPRFDLAFSGLGD